MTADQPGLKACPWCQTTPEVRQIPDGKQFVACRNAACNVQPHTRAFMSPGQAVSVWNANLRAPVEITDEMVERGRIAAVAFAKAQQGDGFYYIADAPHEREAVRAILAAALNPEAPA